MVLLESSKLFSSLNREELEKLKPSIKEISFKPQQVIFNQGDTGDGIYVVKSGKVQIASDVTSNDSRVFSVIGPGEFFGEMAVLDNEPRSATAIAQTDTVLYFLPRDALLEGLENCSALSLLLLREISQRIREFNRHYIQEVLQAERLALVGRFARSIVHDLKNPLNIIGIAAELACTDGNTPESARMCRDRIHKQVERISAMVNEILDFTHHSSTSAVLGASDYAAFVRQLVEEIRPELALKYAEIKMENDPPSVRVPLNPKRLSRVFYNLIHNATDAMPEGGTIRVRFLLEKDRVVTEIEDTGPGIPSEIAGSLFEAFVTYGKAHGTGMGLSITKKIVQDHKGEISARNSPKGGAIFSFSLPLAAYQ